MISLRDVVTGFGNRDPLAEVWRRDLRGGGSAEITGTLPLRYIGNGKPLSDYLVSGNTVQNGTPTHEAPVDAVGCGERTANLFYKTLAGTNIDSSGKIIANSLYDLVVAKVTSGMTYSASGDVDIMAYYVDEPAIGSISYNNSRDSARLTITIPASVKYVVYRATDRPNNAMLNIGPTPLPYEPYGYKLPLTVNGTEYPIYLGEVESTRRIRKLVLTGEEYWYASGSWGKENTAVYYMTSTGGYSPSANVVYVFCDHYSAASRNELYNNDSECAGFTGAASLTFRVSRQYAGTKADFVSYLASQYANGTPVTVWYVLAEPETSIVNEPLMKIGNYADTISFAQSQVAIPTVSGANVLDMISTVKPSEVYIKGKGIKPTNNPNFENGG